MSIGIGRIWFAAAIAAMGILCIGRGDFLYTWAAVPDGLPARELLAIVNGIVLVVAAAGLCMPRSRRVASLVVAGVWLVYAGCHVPHLIASWRAGLGGFTKALGLAALAAVAGGEKRISRHVFGACVVAYGVVHFLWPDFVADFIPSWIPGRPFWAYATGVAFLAAGLAALTGVLALLATRLLAVMFTAWLVVLHVPRVVAALGDPHEWATLFIATAFAGGTWVFSETAFRGGSPGTR